MGEHGPIIQLPHVQELPLHLVGRAESFREDLSPQPKAAALHMTDLVAQLPQRGRWNTVAFTGSFRRSC